MRDRLRRWLFSLYNLWKVKSIQLILTISFTVITLGVMIVVSVILYDKFAETAERNAHLSNQQIVEQVNYNLELYLRGMTDVFGSLEQRLRDTGIGSGGEPALLEPFETIAGTRKDLVSMTLLTLDGEPIFSLPSGGMREGLRLREQGWFQAALDRPNSLTFSLPHIQNLYKGQYKWVVSMTKVVPVVRAGRTENAVLLVDINFSTIDELCRRVSLGNKGYVYIIDEGAGNMIYHPQQQLIYIGLKYENVEQVLKYAYGSFTDEQGGERRLVTIKTVSGVGWKIVGVSYMDEIMTARKEISGFMVWLLVVVIVFVLLISAFMSARISRPIKRLERSMRRVEQGDFDLHVPVGGEDEVGRLSRQFNVMVGRIGELVEQNIREQEAKRRSELEVLQSQINPHFLYNTLNTVVRMAGSGKGEDVVTMITSLSKFFRISLSRGQNIIPVADELDHVRNYLIIQKVRYKNQFEFQITADEQVTGLLTMKLLLQPLVENAIYHGVELMPDPGRIEVRANVCDGKLRFQVRDNGLGIREERLREIRQELYGLGGSPANGKTNDSTTRGDGSGVGVKNVHERIRLRYGEPYGLVMESEPEEGTTVTLWLPLLREGGRKE
ncbi:sensor histidine kinase [Paenibacillus sp. GD4]|uniref:cache domain-containing sensor histidine kinase n=1 Tax=Paenibacillus sp. GD4 TaxID=3068890 RepID=UPI00279660D6|nr:sensor histidine kinase [Paenibacillus sp. GD4]MDQ1910694.1 sensor histidine kinase [Paenibacillus sp. GD4]